MTVLGVLTEVTETVLRSSLPRETLGPVRLQLWFVSEVVRVAKLVVPITCGFDCVLEGTIEVSDRCIASGSVGVKDVVRRVELDGLCEARAVEGLAGALRTVLSSSGPNIHSFIKVFGSEGRVSLSFQLKMRQRNVPLNTAAATILLGQPCSRTGLRRVV